MSALIYTIGFTKKSAEKFFETLIFSDVEKLVDIRLNNTSQLAGFAKKDDLIYFLDKICGIDYEHRPEFAPTQDMLDAYKKNKGDWEQYEKDFAALMRERGAVEKLDLAFFDQPVCLLCSEAAADRCHRRLVAEAIAARWPEVRIIHL